MIRIRKQIDSETLHLPELRPLIGKTVEIFVVDQYTEGGKSHPYTAWFALSGTDAVEPEAYRQLRAASMI